MLGFHIAEPNSALIVSGKHGKGDGSAESQRYKIISSGDRVFVWPIIQSARELALDLRKADVPVNCVTTQGIPVRIQGVVAFKVGSDFASIGNAAQRFLHDPNSMGERVHELFAGHIRGIVGSLNVEDLIRNREALTNEARNATALDMEKMGLTIDSLQIAEIEDPSGYIENLSQPDIARVKMESRIAQAQRDREASEREAENAAEVAAAQRASAIKQAGFKAEVDKAQAEAAQAGPLAAAEAQKAVTERQTEVAMLVAAQREQELVSEVQKPAEADRLRQETEAEANKRTRILDAEAEAEATRTQAQASAEATKARGQADAEITQTTGEAQAASDRAQGLANADVVKAKGLAEGEALKARAEGLAQESEAVIAQQLADKLPEIVGAAAGAFDNVGTMTVLNGADGVMEAVNSIVAMAGTTLKAARGEVTTNGNGNGAKAEVPS